MNTPNSTLWILAELNNLSKALCDANGQQFVAAWTALQEEKKNNDDIESQQVIGLFFTLLATGYFQKVGLTMAAKALDKMAQDQNKSITVFQETTDVIRSLEEAGMILHEHAVHSLYMIMGELDNFMDYVVDLADRTVDDDQTRNALLVESSKCWQLYNSLATLSTLFLADPIKD